ncbi:hypothetical protein DXG01_012106 [Tephrocybe rancida]|nr:hypothetical protein DXG01_012106 [Tephrocybe rancida]
MALAVHAIASTPKAALHPPASPFAELLRRSKFAAYDPAIRQTYQAPPANAHRGDWGVKRPISLRRKNAFISLTTFEHHAHFTEWNHAENQVRFVRRIEEMGAKVTSKQASDWYRSLGKAKGNPPFDSDFCPGEDGELAYTSTYGKTVNLESLGKRGPGAYGTQRAQLPPPRDQEVYVSHNINAMPKRQFRRYLRSLRAQRPEFQEFIDGEAKIKEKNLYALAANNDSTYYRRFLQSQMQKSYDDFNSTRMEPQPHPNAALMYDAPTPVESKLWIKAKPGFVLHADYDAYSTTTNRSQKNFLVSFGGLSATVDQSHVAGRSVLLDSSTHEGVKQEEIENSIMQMRLDPTKGIHVALPPKAVGNKPQGLKAIKITPHVIKEYERIGIDNPHPIGTAEYVAMDRAPLKSELKSFNTPKTARKIGSSSWGGGQQQREGPDLITALTKIMEPSGKNKEL